MVWSNEEMVWSNKEFARTTVPAGAAAALGCLGLLALLAAGGCGSGNSLDLAPVRGTVTYQGKALDHGSVVFIPDSAAGTKGPQAVGQIRPDGSFTMRTATSDGAAVGKHIVLVHCRKVPTAEQAKDMYFVPESLIPLSYSKENQTTLRFEVKKGTNKYDIELK